MSTASQSASPRKGGRPVRADVEKRHQIILDAAEDVFLSHGFAGASVDQIAGQAGTSKQTVYARFGTKEALFVEVSNRMLAPEFHSAHQNTASLREQLISTAIEILEAMLDPKMVRMYRIIIAEAERFPELAKLSDQDEYFTGRSALLNALEVQGLGLPAEALRPAMLMLLDMILAGPLRSAALGLDTLASSDYSARASWAVDIFLKGIGFTTAFQSMAER
jgi:AcrR family transcriptional regulator